MLEKLVRNQVITFLLSLVLTWLLYLVWVGFKLPGSDEPRSWGVLILIGDIFINVMLLAASMPVLFLINPDHYNNLLSRILYYFLGPVCMALLFVVVVSTTIGDVVAFLVPSVCYLSLHTYFYLTLPSEHKKDIH
jgi:hypothetical protein